MKFFTLLSAFVTLSPVITFALDTVTVRIDTGTCAATYSDTARNGNGVGSPDPTAVASGVDKSMVPIAALETILSEPAPILTSLIDTTVALESLKPTGTHSPVPTVASPAVNTIISVDLSGFLILFQESNPGAIRPHETDTPIDQNQRRQTASIFTGYISHSGQTAVNCHNSMVYSLSDSGMLSTKEGAVFSTTPGTVFQRLNASEEIKSIHSTWEISNKTTVWKSRVYNNIVWNNKLFSNETADFCVVRGNLRVYFLFPPQQDCHPVDLVMLPLSTCDKAVKHITVVGTARMPSPTSTSTEPNDTINDYDFSDPDRSVDDGSVDDDGSGDHGIPS